MKSSNPTQSEKRICEYRGCKNEAWYGGCNGYCKKHHYIKCMVKTNPIQEARQPKLRVIPLNPKEDKEKAKLLTKWINYEYKKHKKFVDAITRARIYIEKIYGLETCDQPWEMILKAYLTEKLDQKVSKK